MTAEWEPGEDLHFLFTRDNSELNETKSGFSILEWESESLLSMRYTLVGHVHIPTSQFGHV